MPRRALPSATMMSQLDRPTPFYQKVTGRLARPTALDRHGADVEGLNGDGDMLRCCCGRGTPDTI